VFPGKSQSDDLGATDKNNGNVGSTHEPPQLIRVGPSMEHELFQVDWGLQRHDESKEAVIVPLSFAIRLLPLLTHLKFLLRCAQLDCGRRL
jgi:hypothetical protein